MAKNKAPKHQMMRKPSKQQQAYQNMMLDKRAQEIFLAGYQRGINTVIIQVLWSLHNQKDAWGKKRLARLLEDIGEFTHTFMDKGNGMVSVEDITAQLEEECGIKIDRDTGLIDM